MHYLAEEKLTCLLKVHLNLHNLALTMLILFFLEQLLNPKKKKRKRHQLNAGSATP